MVDLKSNITRYYYITKKPDLCSDQKNKITRNNNINMKKRTALIETGKDGTFTIFTPDTQSTVFGDGDTVAKAKADFENTVKEVIEVFEETGRRDPDDLKIPHSSINTTCPLS